MSKPVTLETNSTTGIAWIDAPSEVDGKYISPEVSIISEKAMQAIFDHYIESQLDKLFDLSSPNPWAVFSPFQGYLTGLRRLFKKKILESFDPEFAIETLDNCFENEKSLSEEEGDRIYDMLYALKNLNALLHHIYLQILTCLKP